MASRDLVTLFLRAENFQRRIQMESTITINQALKNKALIHWLLLVLLSWAFFFWCKILFLSCSSCSFITAEELYLGSSICFTILKPKDEEGACRSGVPTLRPRVIFVHQWHKLALVKMRQIKSSKGKRGNGRRVTDDQQNKAATERKPLDSYPGNYFIETHDSQLRNINIGKYLHSRALYKYIEARDVVGFHVWPSTCLLYTVIENGRSDFLHRLPYTWAGAFHLRRCFAVNPVCDREGAWFVPSPLHRPQWCGKCHPSSIFMSSVVITHL